MKPHVFTFKYPEKQASYFRGAVKIYEGSTVRFETCTEVRVNKLKALEDAKKLMKTLSTGRVKAG